MTLLLGPPGCGKTTLLRALAGSLDHSLQVLGLDSCSGVIVGDAMRRGVSGGEKKRVTLGEMIVGPSKIFVMDEISNGLDSSTTFQIISVLQHSVHIMETTLLVSLLQPAPEIFNLFDEIIIMAEGRIIYHGPRDCVFEFFENCGFRCPERKSPSNFLTEVISKKDQAQYWAHYGQPYHYVSVEQFAE